MTNERMSEERLEEIAISVNGWDHLPVLRECVSEIMLLRTSLEAATKELGVLKGEHHRLKMACGRALIEQSGEILRGHGFEEYCCRKNRGKGE